MPKPTPCVASMTAALPRAFGVVGDEAKVVELAGHEAFELRGDRHRAGSRSDLGRRLLAGHAMCVRRGQCPNSLVRPYSNSHAADGDAARIDRAVQRRRSCSVPGTPVLPRSSRRVTAGASLPNTYDLAVRRVGDVDVPARAVHGDPALPRVPGELGEPKRATSVPAASSVR